MAATAIVTKLVRVCMLAPALLLMSSFPALRVRRSDTAAAESMEDMPLVTKPVPPLPWFAIGFVAVAALNSAFPFDKRVVKLAGKASATALAMAMAGLGLDTDLQKIRQLGTRPLILAAVLWAWLLLGVGTVARILVGVFP